MKIETNRQELLTVLSHVASVVPRRTPKPILSCIRLEALGGDLTASGTDGEISIVGAIDAADVARDGVVVVPADRLLSVIREIPGELVTLETTDTGLVIESGLSAFTLATQDAADYPVIGSDVSGPATSIDAHGLREGLRRAVIAADVESARYALGGVQVTLRESSTALVATDSRRLSIVEVESAHAGECPAAQVVPQKAVAALVSILGKSKDNDSATIYLDAREAAFRVGGYLLRTRLVEGRFPAWEKVVPTDAETTVTVDAGALASGLRQVGAVMDGSEMSVRLAFGDKLGISTETAGIGSAAVDVDVDSKSGEDVVMSLNPRLVLDAVKMADGEIVIELTDAETQVLFRIGADWRYIVMPLSREDSK